MSGGLAPSKSTVYASNLPFSLTNNDLHKIFDKYGKVVKVTIMKDRDTRKSKGVAFVLYLDRDSAYKCVNSLNNTEMFGRLLRCSIAKDNGRASDFIRRKEYKDKSRCYECGEEGHLSYKCPHNLLGERDPPKKKEKKRKGAKDESEEHGDTSSGSEEDPREDSLVAAINFQQQMSGSSGSRAASSHSEPSGDSGPDPKRKKYKKDAYFSDEEELDDA